MNESLRPTLVLTTICVVCGGLLAGTQSQLGERVERQVDLFVRGPALERLFELPAEEVLSRKAVVSIEGSLYPVFYQVEGDDVTRLAIEAVGTGGHGGDIVMLFGMDLRDDTFLGMEVVSHSETPGLGSLIIEPSFRSQWEGLSTMQPVALTADGGSIDALTGATITSRAAVNGTNHAVDLMVSHGSDIMDSIAAERSGDPEGGR